MAVIVAVMPNQEIILFGPFPTKGKAIQWANERFKPNDEWSCETVFEPEVFKIKGH